MPSMVVMEQMKPRSSPGLRRGLKQRSRALAPAGKAAWETAESPARFEGFIREKARGMNERRGVAFNSESRSFDRSGADEGADWVNPVAGPAYRGWGVVWAELVEAGVESIPPGEARRLWEEGAAALIDVRTPWLRRSRGVPEGAMSVPLYREVRGNGWAANAKRLFYGLLAMPATEIQPDFAWRAAEAAGNKVAICLDDVGGSLDTCKRIPGKKVVQTPERALGIESRSLRACHSLLADGGLPAPYVAQLAGGVSRWRLEGFPMEQED